MKKIYPSLITIVTLLGLISLFSFAEGYATKNNGGITTAPGDLVKMNGDKETCAKCHSGNQYGSTVEVYITDTDNHNILGYDPGASYKVHVKINHTTGTPAGYGFQMVGLIDKDDTGLQNFTGFGSNVQEVQGILGRKYYEHKGVSNSNEFVMDWVAPNNGAGSVTFYAVGNAVNNNGANSGDGPSSIEFTLTEGLLLGNEVLANISGFSILGNPSLDEINLEINAKIAMEVNFRLYNMNGQEVKSSVQSLFAGKNKMVLDIENIEAGAYIIHIQTFTGQIARKVMVL